MLEECPCCNKKLQLKLMPDYCSSGIWCANCGVNFGDPIMVFEGSIPEGLINLIQGWVWLCEEKSSVFKAGEKPYMESVLEKMGLELNRQLGQYYPSYLNLNVFPTGLFSDNPRFGED